MSAAPERDASSDLPTPQVDADVDRAPGGADASRTESDVGAAAEGGRGEPLTPDPPMSAQTDEAEIPDELQEPEPKQQENTDGADPVEESTEEPA